MPTFSSKGVHLVIRLSVSVVVVVLAVTGCSGQEGVRSTPGPTTPSPSERSAPMSPTPSPSPSPTALPSITSLPSVDESPGPRFRPDTIAVVVTSDLVVRSLPEITDASEILTPLLNEPTLLYIVDGPVRENGYEWYQVQPFSPSLDLLAEQLPFGWVAAASHEGESWIAPATVDCLDADQSDVFELDALHPHELLYCFGDRQIRVTVQAMAICSGYVIGAPNYTIEPAWLGMGSTCGWGREGQYLSAMQPHLEPSVGIQYPPGAERLDWYLLTGRFDHPEAANCALRALPDGHPDMPPMPDLTAAQVVLGCRSVFAVQHAEEIGEPAP